VDVVFRNVDAETAGRIMEILRPAQPEILAEPWTVEEAKRLLRSMGAFTHARRQLFPQLVSAGGRIDASALCGPDSGQLKGLTGPIATAMKRLTDSGELPPGLPAPVRTVYDGDSRRATDFTMDLELVPIFRDAMEQIRQSLRVG
jgi:hypothetical protein